ncbi:dienelactone hydrolase family protein [Peredibacter sp. HCB2-198]|uniref:dienelactone hydrolase family protein n=1 Tax=Peredibacter sp. HCB2-198 TaxID=3383025 RepID=UPI0038B57CFC
MSFFDYTDGETTFEGYISVPKDNSKNKFPCVLVGHAWSGPSEHFYKIADDLAKQGYVGLAFDVYGKGKRGPVDGDNSHLMNPLLEDRRLLRKRLLTAFNEAKKHPQVLSNQIAVMGHCFGGLCALDLARANPEGLKGAISIHGLLNSPNLEETQIHSSVLVLHGWEDPMVSTESILEFTKEMNRTNADWQIHAYGHAMHAFTLEGANIPELGIKYNEKAHKRSLSTIAKFLSEIF